MLQYADLCSSSPSPLLPLEYLPIIYKKRSCNRVHWKEGHVLLANNSLSEPFASEFENEACKMLTGYLYGVDPHLTKNSCATECRSLSTFELFKFTKKLQSREFLSIHLFIISYSGNLESFSIF